MLAFHVDPIWSYVKKVFDKFEACELKGQVMPNKKGKKFKATPKPMSDMLVMY